MFKRKRTVKQILNMRGIAALWGIIGIAAIALLGLSANGAAAEGSITPNSQNPVEPNVPADIPDTFAADVTAYTLQDNVVYWVTDPACPPPGPNRPAAGATDPVTIQRERSSGGEIRTLFSRNDTPPGGDCNPYYINANDGLMVADGYIYWRDAAGVQQLPLTANPAMAPTLVADFPAPAGGELPQLMCGDGALQWVSSDSGSANYRYLTYAFNPLEELAFGDFNGDGETDVFGVLPRDDGFLQWVYSASGEGSFANLAYAGTPLSDLRFGDFDGDGKTDVFTSQDNGDGTYQWLYSSGGFANYAPLAQMDVPLDQLRFGDFDGDGKTDVFALFPRDDGFWQWAYSAGGTQPFANLAYASTLLSDMAFGDLDGDGKTDVFTTQDNGDGTYQWLYSSGGFANYVLLAQSPLPLEQLRFGDFDGDGKTDVFTVELRSDGFWQWKYSASGTGAFQNLAYASHTLEMLRFGDFNGDGKTDVFATLPREGCKEVDPTFYGEPDDSFWAIALGIGGHVRWIDQYSGESGLFYSSARFSTPIGGDAVESQFVNYDSLAHTEDYLFFVERYQDVCNTQPGCFTTPIKTIIKRLAIHYDFYQGYQATGPAEELWIGTDANITPGSNTVTLLTDGQFIFWAKDGNLLRLSVNAAALPRINVRLTGMEITQGIQNTTNSVRLIQGKDTHVRLFARSDGAAVPDVTARIYVSKDGGAEMGPFFPERNLTLTNNPNRLDANQSFTFHLPLWVVDGNTVRVRAALNPFGYPLEPAGGDSDNSLTSSTFNLSPSPQLEVIFAEFNYTLNNTTWKPQGSGKNASWIMNVYPLGYRWTGDWYEYGLDWSTWDIDDANLDERVNWGAATCENQSTHVCGAYYTCQDNVILDTKDNPDNRNLCASDYVNGRLSALRSQRGVGSGTFLYGEIRDTGATGQFPRGQAGVGRTSSGPDAPSRDGYYAGHEVGHTVGLGHPSKALDDTNKGCGIDASDPVPSYPNAQIGPNDNSVNGFFYTNFAGPWQWTVLQGNTWRDMMAYCNNANWPHQWISDQNYERIYTNLSNASLAAETVAQPQVGDWLAVFGSLNPAENRAALSVVERWSEVMTIPDMAAGDYALRQLDAGGSQLAQVSFAPSDESDGGWQAFQLVVPFEAAAARIQIVNLADDTVLAEQAISATPPGITDVSALLNGAQVELSWQASDADGDALTFDVFYSRDGGATYQALQLGLTDSNTVVETSQLGGGDVTFRVIAQDGVQTTNAHSEVVAVPNQAPQILSFSPDCAAPVNYGQAVNFSAAVWDAQDGPLSGLALMWYLNGIPVANGNVLSTQGLNPDMNEIVLVATNSAGLSSDKVCDIFITDDLSIAGPSLSAAPQQIDWSVESATPDVQTAAIGLSNVGGGELTWTASSSAGWLAVTPLQGTTPMTVTLTGNPGGMFSGSQNKATLTLTALDGGNNVIQIVELPVTLWVDHPGYLPSVSPRFVYLPLIVR